MKLINRLGFFVNVAATVSFFLPRSQSTILESAHNILVGIVILQIAVSPFLPLFHPWKRRQLSWLTNVLDPYNPLPPDLEDYNTAVAIRHGVLLSAFLFILMLGGLLAGEVIRAQGRLNYVLSLLEIYGVSDQATFEIVDTGFDAICKRGVPDFCKEWKSGEMIEKSKSAAQK